MADKPGAKPPAKPETVLREDQVTRTGLEAALTLPTPDSSAPAAEQAFGHFNQPGYNANKLIGTQVNAQQYKAGGLELSGTMYAKAMAADVGGEGERISKTIKADKRADLNGDGKVDDREVGAIMVAASLNKQGKFDNGMSQDDIGKVLDPKAREAVIAAARQLTGEGGVVTAKDGGGAAPTVVAKSGDKGQQR